MSALHALADIHSELFEDLPKAPHSIIRWAFEAALGVDIVERDQIHQAWNAFHKSSKGMRLLGSVSNIVYQQIFESNFAARVVCILPAR